MLSDQKQGQKTILNRELVNLKIKTQSHISMIHPKQFKMHKHENRK